MTDLVPCCHKQKDCYAIQNGMCRLLKDTKFHGKDCPFYATKEQTKEDRRKARERLERIGAADLIQKYGGEVTWE